MIRSITIEPVLNGFVLQVGCQRVVFTDAKQLASEIQKYYDNPEETEKSYLENAVNKMQDTPTYAIAGYAPGIGGTSLQEYPRTAAECGLRQ